MFIGGFAAVYQIQVLELTFFEIMVWVTAGNLCRSLCTPLMARLAARIGWKNVTALTIAMMACVAALWAAATRQNAAYLFPVLSILGAVPYAGMGVGFLKMQVATSPSATRSMYLFRQLTVQRGFSSAGLGAVLCAHRRAGGLPAPRTALHLFCGLGRRSCCRSDGRAHSLPGSVNRRKTEKFLGLFFLEKILYNI